MLSWRVLTASLDLFSAPVGARLGANLLLPLAEFGRATTITQNDAYTKRLPSADGEADLTKALGHKKSSFAAEIYIGVYLGF